MKLNIEIKDDKFTYNFEVGKSSGKSESWLTDDALVAFTDLLRICSSVSKHDFRKWEMQTLAEKISKGESP